MEDELCGYEEGYRGVCYRWYGEREFWYVRNKKGFFGGKGGYNDERDNDNDGGSLCLWVNNMGVIIDGGVGS